MAKKSIKLRTGTVYQKRENGTYYYRYQVNGERKAVSLQTKNQKEALAKASDLIPIIQADTAEVISAHVQHAKGLRKQTQQLELRQAWEEYARHPDRAMPATVSERLSYKASYFDFVDYLHANTACVNFADVTPAIAQEFADHLRSLPIAVSTHNRKLKRIRKVFAVLDAYRDAENPFGTPRLFRKPREEQGNTVRRRSFTREQEIAILKSFDAPGRSLKNKEEIRVIYHLGMFTGQRLKDCVLLQWDRVDLNTRKIWVKQFKTGKEVVIPIAPELHAALTGALDWKINNYVCPNVAERYNQVDKNGKNTGNNLVNIDVLRPIRWIGLEPSEKMEGRNKKVTVYGFHSLRHSFASHCAEAGVPKAVVVSILGADSKVIDKYYTHVGDEAQMKAIAAISFANNEVDSPQSKIQKALSYIAELESPSPDVVAIRDLLH